MSTPTIPLFKVLMAPDAADRVAAVLRSGHIAQGPVVDQFEAELAKVLEVPPDLVVTANSGTSALHLAYHVAGIQDGEDTPQVVVSPMTCAATLTPLTHLGAVSFWADVDPVTGNIHPTAVANLLAKNRYYNAVVAIDWAGTPCDYPALRKAIDTVAHHREMPIIEDAAHAFGARRPDGRTIARAAVDDGNHFVCYSFQAIKHLTTGDGGALVCPTREIADRARKLRWFGFNRTSGKDFRCAQELTEAGYKFHMNDVAAAIGLANVPLATHAVERHRAVAANYFAELSGFHLLGNFLAGATKLVVPPWCPGSSWWIYTVLVKDRESFQAFMKERGIDTSQVHRRNDEHPAFHVSWPIPDLAFLDTFAAHQVSIPCGWWMSASDVERVIEAVTEWATR